MGACRDEQLIVGNFLASGQENLVTCAVKAYCLFALHPVHSVALFEIRLHEAESLFCAVTAQICMKNTAGINIGVLRNKCDLRICVALPELAHTVRARSG